MATNRDAKRPFSKLIIAQTKMAAKIEVVIQHALRTFTKYIKKVPDFSQSELHELKLLADGLASDDIPKLGNILSSKGLTDFFRRKKSPIDYFPVYEDDFISVGVFLLNDGAKLPIHDHPDMYGIIKVLEGMVKVTSYSFVEFDVGVEVNNDRGMFYRNPLKVIKHPEVFLDNKEVACMLTPTTKNIHEVECVHGPAAFLDILSPPYEDGEAHEPRVCHYFEEIQSENNLRLVQVDRSI